MHYVAANGAGWDAALPSGHITLHTFLKQEPRSEGPFAEDRDRQPGHSSVSVWTGRTLQLPTPRAIVHGMLPRWGQVRGHCGHWRHGCESVGCEEEAASKLSLAHIIL